MRKFQMGLGVFAASALIGFNSLNFVESLYRNHIQTLFNYKGSMETLHEHIMGTFKSLSEAKLSNFDMTNDALNQVDFYFNHDLRINHGLFNSFSMFLKEEPTPSLGEDKSLVVFFNIHEEGESWPGFVHGGMTASLFAFGFSISSEVVLGRKDHKCFEKVLHYEAPVKSQVDHLMQIKIVKKTETEIEFKGAIEDQDGNICALCESVFKKEEPIP